MAVFRSLELHEPESPHNTNRDVPVALSNLIMRLLAKDPEKRCGSAREVAESLDAIAIVRPKTASVTGQHIARKKAIIVSVVVGVLGLVAFVAGPTLLTRWSNQDSSTKKDEITQSGSSHSQSTSRSTPFLCSFAPPVNYKVGDGPYRVAVGDFNHDRHQDLAVSNSRSDSVSILLGNGDGTFKPTKNYLCGAEPFMLAVHDMNGDGNQDLVVAKRASNTVGVMAGDGKGAFEAPVNYPCGPRPRGLALGDFNADGVADVVVANAVKLPDSSVTVLLGKKDGTLGNMKLNACGGSPISVAVTDFNADGKQDLVTSNSDGNSVSVLLGDGKGNFQPAVDYTVGSGPGAVVVGDFNGDSRPDIVVENFGTNDVTILLGQGDGTFQAAVPYLAHLSPGGLATGDINGDDRLDLVVANHNSVDLSVLLGRGDGTFQPAKNFGVPGAMPAGVAVADFNEDGRADIVVVNWSSKDISLLLNQAPDWHFDVVAPIDRGLFVTRYLLVSITAMDQSNVRDSNYKGTVQFSSSDPRAELPEDYTFTSEDQGSRDVRVWFKTAGPQTVTVVDSETQTRLGWATLRMFAGDIKQLEVRVPSRASVGASIDAEVVALDEYGNESEFTGSVHFTSSDALAVLPPDYTFDKDENGKHTFQVTFRTPGRRTLTVTYSAIVGNATIAVEPATDMP
jgi:hypothetical protein